MSLEKRKQQTEKMETICFYCYIFFITKCAIPSNASEGFSHNRLVPNSLISVSQFLDLKWTNYTQKEKESSKSPWHIENMLS